MRWKKTEPQADTYWMQWFAWRPVVIEDTGETVWLEWIWRHAKRYRSDVHPAGANLEHLG